MSKSQQQMMGFAGLVVGAFVLAAMIGSIEFKTAEMRTAEKSTTGGAERTILGFKKVWQFEFDLPVYKVSATEAQHNEALRSACIEPWMNVKMDRGEGEWQDIDPASGKVNHGAFTGITVLTCLMSHEKARFCVGSERRKIVAALNDYADINRAIVIRAKLERNLPTNQSFMDKIEGTEGKARKGELVDAGIIRALQDLTQDGYLTAKDFGGRVPSELAPYIVNARGEPCRS